MALRRRRAAVDPSPPPAVAEPAAHAPLPGPLAEAVDRIDIGVVVVDGGGQEVFRNEAARRLGSARDGRSLVEGTIRELLERARAGTSCRKDVDLFGPPTQLYVVSAHPFRDGPGIGALAMVEDRSESRRTETVRRDFVANISHELKTPVGALGLLAETISEEDDPEVMRRLARRMVTEAERAARTIDDLLELSRIEFADDTDFTDLAVAAVVGEATSRIANAAEQAGVAVATDLPPGLVVHGDRRQLVSAVFNLLDNAVKYSSEGSTVEVRAAGRPDPVSGEQVEITVEDHGIGIPRRALDRIFERFYRVDRARSRSTGGTGLGLAIVRHVVSNHGGEIVADSVEGQGSTFCLVLPATPGAPSAVASIAGPTAASPVASASPLAQPPHTPSPHTPAPPAHARAPR